MSERRSLRERLAGDIESLETEQANNATDTRVAEHAHEVRMEWLKRERARIALGLVETRVALQMIEAAGLKVDIDGNDNVRVSLDKVLAEPEAVPA